MGPPFCRVLAHIEFVESGPSSAGYFRYIDDILLIYPQDLDLYRITERLNNVELSKFTYEIESKNTRPFLDILLIRESDKLKFRFYHTLTYKIFLSLISTLILVQPLCLLISTTKVCDKYSKPMQFHFVGPSIINSSYLGKFILNSYYIYIYIYYI